AGLCWTLGNRHFVLPFLHDLPFGVGWVERIETQHLARARWVSPKSSTQPTTPQALAFAHRSGRSALFQSGRAEIFFSRKRTSASRCRLLAISAGKPGATSTRASALAKVSRDML